ncbi:glutamyl-tRNA amidotransferase [Colletotrichum truncatum]|uniref:Glutamyl-tRNA amidotransferase n=1 Tax=Colletotrichum truncatum TaxID=5467 RepID=A0ACC3YRW0_COLTU|nr:glutamyl-tRNA amidotransferase [Colletotrichum truncatum]KAF6799371.1 glutamyl-tRNA amidotransferase [Colletotrichum truncatum]
MHFILGIFLFTFNTLHVNASTFHLTGSTVFLDGVSYFVAPSPVGRVQNDAFKLSDGLGLVPFTVVTIDSTGIDSDQLKQTLANFSSSDDVYQTGFSKGIFSFSFNLKISRFPYLPFFFFFHSAQPHLRNTSIIPSGPYFASSAGDVHQAYRLYADVQEAFSETVISNGDGSHSVLPASLPGQSLAVAVPSRLYYTRTIGKPLAGVRIGVKDIFDVHGLRTSNGNRAWYHLYPPANQTAPSIQNLLNAGAVLIGKMKTSQFANGESATADWVDYHAPFNPRGDGYQDPSSSSAGPAAGEAAYEWLDIAVGSDTGGSIRSPSQVQGIFGNRPSHGLVSLNGTMPLAPEFDTIGVLARDPRLWAEAAQSLYGSNINMSFSYPSEILTIGFPDSINSTFDHIVQGFLANLTDFLSAKVKPFNLTESWGAMNPEQPNLLSFINNTYEVLSAQEQARLVRDPFYADYAAANEGRLPHINPAPLQRWALGDRSNSTIEEGLKSKALFMEWFNNEILHRDPRSCSNRLLLYVPRTPVSTPRDRYITGPQSPKPFSTSKISVMSKTPDIVIPIGQVDYASSVTNSTEQLPVTVDLMAAKGCDGMLFGLVNDLLKSNIISISLPGKSHVNGGNILL